MITLTDEEFKKFVQYVYDNYGINLSRKRDLLISRLQNVLVQNQFDSFGQYFDYILHDTTGEAVVTLINKVTTNHTFFMREREHFDFFTRQVLPELTDRVRSKDLRIWSAGCSSGEEPYTLAMLMADYFGPQKTEWDTRILATDISQNALQKAIEGVYSSDQLNGLPDGWKRRYFLKTDPEHYQVTETIRKEVIYRVFNLNNPVLPFKKKFQVIFCRNVMIYFDAATKRALIERFYDFTEPGGYLFIGHAETINRNEISYKSIIPAVYRKE